MKTNTIKISSIILSVFLLTACTFAHGDSGMTAETPGFLNGIWHGIVAPYTLIVRFFIDIKMYAVPNSGIGYDIGFLLGLIATIPIGWLATLISIGFYLLT